MSMNLPTSNLPASNPPSSLGLAGSVSKPSTALEAWNMPIFGDFVAPNVVAAAVVTDSAAAKSPATEPVEWNQLYAVPAHNEPVEVAPATIEDASPEEMLEQMLEGLAPLQRSVEVRARQHVADPKIAPAVEVTSPGEYRFKRGETSEVWGVKLDQLCMDETVDAIEDMVVDRVPRYIITANLNYAMLLAENRSLQTVTDQASLVLADGQPFVWRSRFGSAGRLPERVTGSELIYRIAERAAKQGWRIYFLGAEPGVAQRCADALAKKYPKLKIAGVQSPPYRKQTEAEQRDQRNAIVDSRADILLVAFGQPKGERWIHEHYEDLGVPVSIQVGASFDFVAGAAKRAPKAWQRFGLEWAYRMLSNPTRLVPRYASNAWFLLLAIICDWRDYVNARYGTGT